MTNLSIRFKLLAGSACAILLSLGVVIYLALSSYQTSIDTAVEDTTDIIQRSVKEQLHLTADQIEVDIRQRLQSGFDSVLALATFMGSTANTDQMISRQSARDLVRAQLESNNNVNSMYAQFEPNGYDMFDSLFKGDLQHSSNEGTLDLYWVREGSDITFYPTEDPSSKYDTTLNANGTRKSEWYLCPRDTKRNCMLEPYLYEISAGNSILMTSLTVPIMHAGRFIGVAGTDVNLPALQQLAEELSRTLYKGEAGITLLSTNNQIIASSRYPGSAGQPVSTAAPRLLKELKAQSDTSDNILFEQPMEIADARWRIVVEVPRSVAFAELNELEASMQSNRESTTRNLLMIASGILLVTLVAVNLFISSITKPLAQLGQRMQALGGAEGDLTHELEPSNHAELNAVADGFNSFARKIRALIQELIVLSGQLQQSATNLATTAQQTRASTEDQQKQLQGVAAATNEMTSTATEVANLAGQTAQDVHSADTEIGDTRKTLRATVDEIDSMSSALNDASDSIGSVAKRSDEIYSIIETIRGIAEQTNLLALNAAIEAARAGDQGRGFAVVADEVRGLASRTQDATGEIDNLISALKRDVDGSVEQMQQCRSRASQTVEESRNSYERLEGVSNRITSISENTTQVATAAEEQSMVNEEINRNITSIGDAADTLAEAATQVTLLGQEVSDSAARLDQQLGRFKV
ncbi:MAG: methyl-accepting chemotaxis protein [Oceanospirillales bacterium]|uniref:Methyl-accepting chemotaxis protein n=1 Tax=Marinobacterium halophilum TaxID=267374 RepID=A0A2P8F4Z2_9GAMM|nr:methyl-accepting chemotaxis protein [Marinobacterium halophilum]MBR9830132.1 methyl-accepting chemotaxis protein [Oceanospirillales bacterium]PSL16788.1 methyl-accepting chemotaxis protein [Marinobacterium halophilum]